MTSFTVEPITLSHFAEWQASAVDPDIILRNVWRIEDSAELDQLLNRNSDRRWKHSNELWPSASRWCMKSLRVASAGTT
jgi:hypothetical protein